MQAVDMKPEVKSSTQAADMAAAQRVLRLEADGIRALTASLGDDFSRTLDLLGAVEGRIVVTGMGKSGHIARKIAATLASTGSPALYVHPGEASHGDLGMITTDDAVVALSNSGETPELTDLVAYTRRFSISLVAITSGGDSSLAENADVTLLLPATPEACPMGLAPTTSTTVMLALGDAIAVSLLERRGFSPDDFQVLHPGGQLGRNLARVSDLMHAGDRLPLTGVDTSMADALVLMTAKSLGCVGALDGQGRLVGIVTDGDLRRHMGADLLQRTVGEVMTAGPRTIRPQALAAEALGQMNALKITALFVVENDRPIGLLHIHDVLRAGVA